MLRTLLLAFSLLLCVALSSTAHASIIPVLDTVTLIGSEYEFSYSGTLAGDTGLVDGNRIVIFDFQGYVDGSIDAGIYAADVDAYVELTSTISAAMLGYDDDPTIENLVFEWTGSPFNASGGPFPDVSFAGLTARSIYSATHIDGYAALTVINNGAATGLLAFNAGPVAVPVPEPGALALLVAGCGLLARRRAGAA
jgi:hypothetical protein